MMSVPVIHEVMALSSVMHDMIVLDLIEMADLALFYEMRAVGRDRVAPVAMRLAASVPHFVHAVFIQHKRVPSAIPVPSAASALRENRICSILYPVQPVSRGCMPNLQGFVFLSVPLFFTAGAPC